jgi:hypothetical protein
MNRTACDRGAEPYDRNEQRTTSNPRITRPSAVLGVAAPRS